MRTSRWGALAFLMCVAVLWFLASQFGPGEEAKRAASHARADPFTHHFCADLLTCTDLFACRLWTRWCGGASWRARKKRARRKKRRRR